MKREELLAGCIEERERFIGFAKGLTPQQWAAPSLCDGWTVRDVVAHLVGNVDDVLTGSLQDFGSEAFNQRQLDARAGATPEQLLAEWEDKGPKVDALFGAIPDEAWDVVIPQIGLSAGMGVHRLLEDLWVHAHDVRLALGTEATKGPGLTATLEVLVLELPARCEAFAPGVGAVEMEVEGLSARADVGAGAVVRLSGDPVVLALTGTGRTKLEDARADGRLSVDPAPAGLDEAINIYGTPVPTPA